MGEQKLNSIYNEHEDFVTYKQALALKKLGFDEKVNHYYYFQQLEESVDGSITNYDNCNSTDYIENVCSAPTLAQVQKWLNKEKGYIVSFEPRFYKGKKPLMGYCYSLYNKYEGMLSYAISSDVYSSPEVAISAGIDECLKILEENG